jgi:hypothetical protein
MLEKKPIKIIGHFKKPNWISPENKAYVIAGIRIQSMH